MQNFLENDACCNPGNVRKLNIFRNFYCQLLLSNLAKIPENEHILVSGNGTRILVNRTVLIVRGTFYWVAVVAIIINP